LVARQFAGIGAITGMAMSVATDPLGYRLRRALWGQGYATEGARALIDAGFVSAGLRRIVATTYQDNRASRRVMEKAGRTFVRSFRLTAEELAAPGTYHVVAPVLWEGDDVEYALSREEWARRQNEGVRVS